MKINCYQYEPIGMRIAAARKNKRYTQEMVAKKVGVNTQQISQIETGKSGISIPTLQAICETLDVSADYILFGYQRDCANPVNDLLKELSPEQTAYVEDLLRSIVKLIHK